MLTEQFKSIKDYEGLYEISNFGRVKALEKTWYTGMYYGVKRHQSEKILKTQMGTGDYLHVLLHNGTSRKSVDVHTLVWDAFGDKPREEKNFQIDHKDNNKQNNYADNLQLLTHRENTTKGWLNKKKYNLPTGIKICGKKFQARIGINKKQIHLGTFDGLEQASLAYQKALENINADRTD